MPVNLVNSSAIRHQTLPVVEVLRRKLTIALPYGEVQEVGSSSVPNVLTKGDVDLVVLVDESNFPAAREYLESVYDINEGMEDVSLFASFKGALMGVDFGIQLITSDAEFGFIPFREVLKANSDLVQEYNKLKTAAAHLDMDDYRKRKNEFIERIISS